MRKDHHVANRRGRFTNPKSNFACTPTQRPARIPHWARLQDASPQPGPVFLPRRCSSPFSCFSFSSCVCLQPPFVPAGRARPRRGATLPYARMLRVQQGIRRILKMLIRLIPLLSLGLYTHNEIEKKSFGVCRGRTAATVKTLLRTSGILYMCTYGKAGCISHTSYGRLRAACSPPPSRHRRADSRAIGQRFPAGASSEAHWLCSFLRLLQLRARPCHHFSGNRPGSLAAGCWPRFEVCRVHGKRHGLLRGCHCAHQEKTLW